MPTMYCRHIRINGRRCCAFALKTSAFCYFHSNSITRHRGRRPGTGTSEDAMPTVIHPMNTTDHRQRNPLVAEYYSGTEPQDPLTFNFPALEDRESIQVAISMLVTALGNNRIDGKRAAPILYALQVASSNAKALNFNGGDTVVRETIIDDAGHELSLDEDPEEITELNEYMESLDDDEEDDEDEED